MRSVIFVLVLVLCTCTLASAQVPPAAGAVPDTAAFLESLRTPDPVMAKSGGLATKSSCTVNLTCDAGGYWLSCTSASGNCHSGSTWVSCDDVQQNCPVCYRSKICCDGSTIECWGWSSCSTGGPRNVVCDGVIQGTCPPLSQCG